MALAPPAPRLLCDTRALTALAAAPAGELWKLNVPGSELDARISHLLPGQRVNTQTEQALDALVLILAGGRHRHHPTRSAASDRGSAAVAAARVRHRPHGRRKRPVVSDGPPTLSRHTDSQHAAECTTTTARRFAGATGRDAERLAPQWLC